MMAGRAAKNSRWKGGARMITSQGYVRVRVGRSHPLADSKGYAYEHDLVWVAAGRPRPTRAVPLHHKDEDKTHNRLGNLKLKPRAAHSREHAARKPRDRRGRWKPEGRRA